LYARTASLRFIPLPRLASHFLAPSRLSPASFFPFRLSPSAGIIFLDHREAYKLDALTVNETAHAPPSEDEEAEPLNNREKLSEEATFLHQMFTQQVRREPACLLLEVLLGPLGPLALFQRGGA